MNPRRDRPTNFSFNPDLTFDVRRDATLEEIVGVVANLWTRQPHDLICRESGVYVLELLAEGVEPPRYIPQYVGKTNTAFRQRLGRQNHMAIQITRAMDLLRARDDGPGADIGQANDPRFYDRELEDTDFTEENRILYTRNDLPQQVRAAQREQLRNAWVARNIELQGNPQRGTLVDRLWRQERPQRRRMNEHSFRIVFLYAPIPENETEPARQRRINAIDQLEERLIQSAYTVNPRLLNVQLAQAEPGFRINNRNPFGLEEQNEHDELHDFLITIGIHRR